MSQPTLFLDRDGIIVKDAGYTRDANLVELIPQIIPVLLKAKQLNYLIVVVTNQSGLGRGSILFEEYLAVTQRMLDLIQAHQGPLIDHIYFAPFYQSASEHLNFSQTDWAAQHNNHLKNQGRWDHSWRKPNVGMIEQACLDFNIALDQSLLIGDRWSDQELAITKNLKAGLWFTQEAQTQTHPRIHQIKCLTEALPFLDTPRGFSPEIL